MNSEYSYEDFTELILESLRNKKVDYCFNVKELLEIKEKCQKENLGLLYKKYYNKIHKELEYVELFPVFFWNHKEKIVTQLSFDEAKEKGLEIEFLSNQFIDDFGIRKRKLPKRKKGKKEKGLRNFGLTGTINF